MAKQRQQGKRTKEELEAIQEEVADKLRDQKDEYIQCRGLLHAWRVHQNFRIVPSFEGGPKMLRRDLECMRGCGVVRHDTYLLNFTGKGEPYIREKLPNHYTYPKDYQIPGVPRGVKRQSLVYQEEFRRALQQAASDLENGLHPKPE